MILQWKKPHLSRTLTIAVFLFCFSFAAYGQSNISISNLPSKLNWQNSPQSWNLSPDHILTIVSKAKSDWFVDPFDGTVANSAPILSFTPNSDYVLSTRISVTFKTKWDAGALMLMDDDHHWAKLSYEFSPDGKPTLVTVVTRGLSDDCNSVSLQATLFTCGLQKAAKRTSSTFPKMPRNGTYFAPSAWIRIFPSALASNPSHQQAMARPQSSLPSLTTRTQRAIYTSSLR